MRITCDFLYENIIECFGSLLPDTIMIGGSYATGEECILKMDNEIYWLSDIDLLCVRRTGYNNEETHSIYRNMLALSKSQTQCNPYFHIGMKLRTPMQLRHEINTLYLREILMSNVVLHGPSISTLPELSNVMTLGTSFMLPMDTLANWGLTRLWCNILFLPIKAITSDWKEGSIWYSYFIARGALDWITWDLIGNDLFHLRYADRIKEWMNINSDTKNTKELLLKCLSMKTGIKYFDFKDTFAPIMTFSEKQMKKILDESNDKEQFIDEMLFLVEMINIIKEIIEGKCNINSIDRIKSILSIIIKKEVLIQKNEPLLSWDNMRSEYNKFRFLRSEQDKVDHSVYTNHFLELGKP